MLFDSNKIRISLAYPPSIGGPLCFGLRACMDYRLLSLVFQKPIRSEMWGSRVWQCGTALVLVLCGVTRGSCRWQCDTALVLVLCYINCVHYISVWSYPMYLCVLIIKYYSRGSRSPALNLPHPTAQYCLQTKGPQTHTDEDNTKSVSAPDFLHYTQAAKFFRKIVNLWVQFVLFSK